MTRRGLLKAAGLLALGIAWPKGAAATTDLTTPLRVIDARGGIVLDCCNEAGTLMLRPHGSGGIYLR